MNITPVEFIAKIKEGKTEHELNLNENIIVYNDIYKDKALQQKMNSLITYGHNAESALEYLNTDYTNGFTVCGVCGSYAYMGKGFSKHLSKGCVHCEGLSKHDYYEVKGNHQFPARTMCQMFDDGMHYIKDKLEKEKYKNEVQGIE